MDELNKLVDDGELIGKKAKEVEDGNKKVVFIADEPNKDFKGAAYWFNLTPANKPNTVEFAVAAYLNTPFVKQSVSKTLSKP